MAVFEIPIDSTEPDFSQSVELDGTTFVLGFTWTDEGQSWYLSLSDEDGNRVLSGKRIAANWYPLARYRLSTFPKGDIYFVDASDGGDPGRFDLGTRVLCMYVDRGGIDV